MSDPDRGSLDAALTEVLAAAWDAGRASADNDQAEGRAEVIEQLAQRYRELRTVPAAEDIPVRAVAHNHADGSIVARFDEIHGVVFGDDRPFPWEAQYLRGPLTLLWHPEDGMTAP